MDKSTFMDFSMTIEKKVSYSQNNVSNYNL